MAVDGGFVDEAVTAYQAMIDLKPCLPTYCRVAHVRWLKGDLEGAIEMMDQAISTGSDREREPLAWAYTRLAGYTLQRGDLDAADRAAQRALDLIPDYSSALLARGRVALARRDFESAAAVLTAAALRNPLPEYLWAQADALRAAGRAEEAAAAEQAMHARGALEDPRTYSLFLATRGERSTDAGLLARAELETRRDVFTHDAVAWASLAAGDIAAARRSAALAVAEGTEDGRLLLHAGLIARAAGATHEADAFLARARAAGATLLPCERSILDGEPPSLSVQNKIP